MTGEHLTVEYVYYSLTAPVIHVPEPFFPVGIHICYIDVEDWNGNWGVCGFLISIGKIRSTENIANYMLLICSLVLACTF